MVLRQDAKRKSLTSQFFDFNFSVHLSNVLSSYFGTKNNRFERMVEMDLKASSNPLRHPVSHKLIRLREKS